jgi:HTH-type transcriptional repressor of NAD biosynthesis genes
MTIHKFIFVGPESTGKTTLCQILSQKYSTPWVKEACRTMAEEKINDINPNIDASNINFNFTLDDFIMMANRQNFEEKELEKMAKNILICDNDSFAISIWCERYLGKYYEEIYDIYKNAVNLNNDDKIYILTKPNVPFVQDGLRDGEHIRDWMFDRFCEELKNKNMKYHIIDNSNYNKRLEKAIEIIERYINL